MPALSSVAQRALPIGMAHDVLLKNDIAYGQLLTFDDVMIDETSQAMQLRREAERMAS